MAQAALAVVRPAEMEKPSNFGRPVPIPGSPSKLRTSRRAIHCYAASRRDGGRQGLGAAQRWRDASGIGSHRAEVPAHHSGVGALVAVVEAAVPQPLDAIAKCSNLWLPKNQERY